MSKVVEKVSEKVSERIEDKVRAIIVRPYLAPGAQNMGLEKYGMVIHDGVSQVEYISCATINGVPQYITGLNESAMSIVRMEEGDKKEAKIRQIRERVVYLEKVLAANKLDVDDPEFWSKVTIVHPTNHSFWKDVHMKLTNGAIYLDPKNPMDLIKICAIEAGGFGEIAKSYADAKNAKSSPKFYLDRAEETSVTHTELKKLRNKALARLEHLYNKETTKLIYLVKLLDPTGYSFKRNSSPDSMYDSLDTYINAEGPESSKRRAATDFLNLDKMPQDELIIRAMIKDATTFNYLTTKADGMIYHAKTVTMLGRNVEECVEKLMNPLQEKTYLDLKKEVEKHW